MLTWTGSARELSENKHTQGPSTAHQLHLPASAFPAFLPKQDAMPKHLIIQLPASITSCLQRPLSVSLIRCGPVLCDDAQARIVELKKSDQYTVCVAMIAHAGLRSKVRFAGYVRCKLCIAAPACLPTTTCTASHNANRTLANTETLPYRGTPLRRHSPPY